jgi:hypothetical protein
MILTLRARGSRRRLDRRGAGYDGPLSMGEQVASTRSSSGQEAEALLKRRVVGEGVCLGGFAGPGLAGESTEANPVDALLPRARGRTIEKTGPSVDRGPGLARASEARAWGALGSDVREACRADRRANKDSRQSARFSSVPDQPEGARGGLGLLPSPLWNPSQNRAGPQLKAHRSPNVVDRPARAIAYLCE